MRAFELEVGTPGSYPEKYRYILIPTQTHSRTCSIEIIQCPSCNFEHSHAETVAHAEQCPAAIVPCEQASHGCDWTGERLALKESHIRNCPYVALRGFFRRSDAQVAALETENSRLRARLDSAEGMLAVMRHELQAIKGALGPWYRPDAGAESIPLSPQSQAFSQPPSYSFPMPSPASAPANSWRASHHHETPADVMTHLQIASAEDPSISASLDSVTLTPHAPYASIAPSDLAAYFPPPSAGDGPGTLSPQSTTTSWPSLSTALTALRTALQTHDARSRMAASAHAAELAAMRQIVAGLRMQLHAVLLERSGANADGSGAGVGGWNPAARFLLNPPALAAVGHTAASITKL
jgi:hypothetical protein